MNIRIGELAEQAGLKYDFNPMLWLKYENFAELIVREVFAKIEDERFEIYQPVKESVMKHLGVDE